MNPDPLDALLATIARVRLVHPALAAALDRHTWAVLDAVREDPLGMARRAERLRGRETAEAGRERRR